MFMAATNWTFSVTNSSPPSTLAIFTLDIWQHSTYQFCSSRCNYANGHLRIWTQNPRLSWPPLSRFMPEQHILYTLLQHPDTIQINGQLSPGSGTCTSSEWLLPTTSFPLPFFTAVTDLRTDSMRNLRCNAATMEEAYLMGAIKRLVVKDESTLVRRMKLNRMIQSPWTGIKGF